MGLISWVVFGALAGWLSRMIMPGKDPGGCVVTPLIGIVGAVLGGWIATLLGFGGISGFDFRSFIIAVLGALIVLFIYHKVKGR
ncbi:MAG TPA: GlsB/YeaQ/YmgE family stress response membrane protein [Thermoanaerobaculia bacterium]|nr:GlsB/YeaQ/YmgE family stress response membrane protein [Thermoanaerobaculia bacterium]